MNKNERTLHRDDRLLENEKRYRANAPWTLFFLVVWFVIFAPARHMLADFAAGSPERYYICGMYGFLLAATIWSRYVLALKLRHIDSIKLYRTAVARQSDIKP